MEKYDYIFAGAGCAALSLTYHLSQSSLKHKKILLLDPLIHQVPDKTWCYWANKPLDIHPSYAIHSWEKLNLSFGQKTQSNTIGTLKYFHLNSHDFYSFLFDQFKKNYNISLHEASVTTIEESDSGLIVNTEKGEKFLGQIVFDSRFDPENTIDHPHLKQIFTGWRVETSQEVFDPEAFTLMEVEGNQGSPFDFFYVLPYSAHSALVEYTAYSKSPISRQTLEKKLRNYLSDHLKLQDYKISFQESGIIPMTNLGKIKSPSASIVPIGTAAGWTKSSTGYTFQRIQHNCKKIVSNLEKGLPILRGTERSARFAFYDNILLNIASKWPNRLAAVFEDLFRKNPSEKVLRFLSEETTLSEEIALLSKLKFSIFIKSLLHYEPH